MSYSLALQIYNRRVSLFVFRAGIPIAVPADYADQPDHQTLVAKLVHTNKYAEAVAVLEEHPDSYLAADVLTGAAWAQRYLNATALLSHSKSPADRAMSRRGTRALIAVLSGVKRKVGRHRKPPLSPEEAGKAAAAIDEWRYEIARMWDWDRDTLIYAVTKKAGLSVAHRTALRRMLRRRRLRKQDVIFALASWVTGVPIRRLRACPQPADLIYR